MADKLDDENRGMSPEDTKPSRLRKSSHPETVPEGRVSGLCETIRGMRLLGYTRVSTNGRLLLGMLATLAEHETNRYRNNPASATVEASVPGLH